MEDLLEKLALMKKCEISAEVGKRSFSSANTSINYRAEIITHLYESLPEEEISRKLVSIREECDYMLESYASIEQYFPEMDENDEDFSTLFKTRELLPKLDNAVCNFVDLVEKGNLPNVKVSESYTQLREVCVAIMGANKPTYASKIKDLEKKLGLRD